MGNLVNSASVSELGFSPSVGESAGVELIRCAVSPPMNEGDHQVASMPFVSGIALNDL